MSAEDAPVGDARAAASSNVRGSVDITSVHAQIPRISSIAQCLDGRPSEGETAFPLGLELGLGLLQRKRPKVDPADSKIFTGARPILHSP